MGDVRRAGQSTDSRGVRQKNGDPTPLESVPVTSGEDDEQRAADSVNRAVKSLAEKREAETVRARGK